MSVDAKIPQTVEAQKRIHVAEFNVDMFILDLGRGLDRDAIANKYAFTDQDTGEITPLTRKHVDLMFQDPALKGRKPSKVRALPFKFVGTATPETVQEAGPVVTIPVSTVESAPEVDGGSLGTDSGEVAEPVAESTDNIVDL